MRARTLLPAALLALLLATLAPLSPAAPAHAGRVCAASHANPADALFCMKCGAKLTDAPPAPEPGKPEAAPAQAAPPDYETLFGDAPSAAEPPAAQPPEPAGDAPAAPAPPGAASGEEGFTDLLEPDPDARPPQGAKRGGTLTRWFGSDPRGMNYICEAGADVSDNIYAYVAETLADRHAKDPDKWAPLAASRVEVSADRTLYRVTLRPGIKWHPPLVDWADPNRAWLAGEHPLTTRDVAFYLDLVRDPTIDTAGLGAYYDDLAGYEIVDERVILIRWKRKVHHSIASTLTILPFPEFIYKYDENGKLIPKEGYGERFAKHWFNNRAIGSGPYRFANYTPGVSITLERNEAYDGLAPMIDRLHYLVYRDENQNLLKLKAMEQDIAMLTASQYRDEVLQGRPVSPVTGEPLNVGVYQSAAYYYIGWNLTRPPFSDKAVRRAMTLAFNRKELLENVFYNLGELTESPVYKFSPFYNEALIPHGYSLEQAAKALDSADWIDRDGDGIREKYGAVDKHTLDFKLLIYADSAEWRTVATVFRDDLKKIGVRMEIVPVDWAVLQSRMDARDFDAYTGGWGLQWDPDPWQVWHSSQVDALGGSNKIGFRNEEADRIMEELRVAFDRAERKRLLDRFQAILHEEQPYTFFFTRKHVALWWDHLRNVSFRKLSPHDLSLPWHIAPR